MTKTALPVRDMCVAGIFTAVTAVLAQIAIPLPFTPTPFSLGMMAVYLCGMLLKPRTAVLTQVCYLALGAVGLPVFGGFRGGVGALFGPTGGFLFAYPLMAAVIALALNRGGQALPENGRERAVLCGKAAGALVVSLALLYTGGSLWLGFTTGNTFAQAFAVSALPFLPMDMVKIAVCIVTVLPMRERLIKMHLLR